MIKNWLMPKLGTYIIHEYIHTYIHTYHTYIRETLPKREPKMNQDWAAVGATWRLNAHICCKDALVDPLGTRIGIEFQDAVRSKPTANVHTYIHTYIHTSENTEEITVDQWKRNKKPDACFPTCCEHARGVSLAFSALSESETARLIASYK
jgi:hypothetical protein